MRPAHVAIALLALLVGACGQASRPPATATASMTAAATIAPTARPSAGPSSVPEVAIPVPEPYALAADGSTMWVISGRDIARIDVATNTVRALNLGNGDDLENLVATPSAVWVTDFDANKVLKIDPVTGRIVDRIATGAAEDVLPVDGSIWVTNHHEGSISRIDPRTDKVIGTVVVGEAGPDGPQQLGQGAGSVWVGEYNTEQVIRMDPRTGAVVARIAMPPSAAPCGPITATDTAVWITGCHETPTLARIDPTTNRVVATIQLAGYAENVLVINGAVWAPVGGDGSGLGSGDGYKRELERINPATNLVDRTLPVARLTDVQLGAVAGGDLWLPDGMGAIIRVPLSALTTP